LAKGHAIEPLIPKIQKRLQYIMQQSLLASRRVEAVRETASPDDMTREPVVIEDVFNASLNALSDLIAAQKVEVSQKGVVGLPRVLGNSKQMEIVFSNLIKNAAESMAQNPPGKPRLLELTAEQNNGAVYIRISDTGPGIAADIQAKLFKENVSSKG